MVRTISCDVLVVGGSLGGVAAALAAGRRGARVCLLAGSRWLGGQLTEQGVCTPDDTISVETVGSTLSYRTVREGIRAWYRTRYRLSAEGVAMTPFIPGDCWVGYLSTEPRVADTLLKAMLADVAGVKVYPDTQVVRCEVQDDRVRLVAARSKDGTPWHFLPRVVLDATDVGDLLPLAGAEFVTGAESGEETGEPDAAAESHPEYIQPFTFPFIVELRPAAENHTILPPYDYQDLRASEGYHLLDGAMTGMFTGRYPFWTYRRVLSARVFDDAAVPYDVSSINTNSIDYKEAVLPGAARADVQRARRAALGFLYWLQTECPREDDPARRGYPELLLRKDLFGTFDGIAPAPYIRESRRIVPLQRIREQDVAANFQPGPRARHFATSCGVGDFFMDVHPGKQDPQRFFVTRPYQIPVDALIPIRLRNLLAACKNIGTTHLTNGCYRTHPLEWSIGEAAGMLAAWSLENDVEPSVVHGHAGRLRHFQQLCVQSGMPVFWWSDVPWGHPAYEATQMLGMQGFFGGEPDLRFRPDDPLTPADAEALARLLGEPVTAATGMTRAQCAVWLYARQHERLS